MENIDVTGTGLPDLCERLKIIRMSESERQFAMVALQIGELACELVARAAGWFGALRGALLDPDWHRPD